MKMKSLFVLATVFVFSNSCWLGALEDPFFSFGDSLARMVSSFDECRKQICQSFSNLQNYSLTSDSTFDYDNSEINFVDGKVNINLPSMPKNFEGVGQGFLDMSVNDVTDFNSDGQPITLCKISESADNFKRNVEVEGSLSIKDPKVINLRINYTFEIDNSKSGKTAFSKYNSSGSRSFCIKIPDGFLPKIKAIIPFGSSHIELEFEKSSEIDQEHKAALTEKPASVLSIIRDGFSEKVLGSEKPAVVYCYAPWSSDCVAFNSVFESQAPGELKNLNLFKIDMKDVGDLAGQYKIDSIPTILIFKNGKLLGKITREKLLKMNFSDVCKKIRSAVT